MPSDTIYSIKGSTATALANKIRSLTGKQGTMSTEDMIDELDDVQSSGSALEPSLPIEYQEVEYISFTRNAGFLVDIPNVPWLLVCQASYEPLQNYSTIVGYRGSSLQSQDFEIGYQTANSGEQCVWIREFNPSNFGIIDSTTSPESYVKYDIKAMVKTIHQNAYIGTYIQTADGLTGKIYGSLRYYDIFERTLLKKYTPCYLKSNNTIGYYECVSDTFYSTLDHDSNGAAVVGPDVM